MRDLEHHQDLFHFLEIYTNILGLQWQVEKFYLKLAI